MKSLIMLAGLLVLASCSDSDSAAGSANAAANSSTKTAATRLSELKKGDAVSNEDLKVMLTNFEKKRKERGFQRKQTTEISCNESGEFRERLETYTVLSVTGNARVERIESIGDGCEKGEFVPNVSLQKIMIEKESEVSEIDLSEISNARLSNQILTFETVVEEEDGEMKVISELDLSTSCIKSLTSIDGTQHVELETCGTTDVESMDLREDVISMHSVESAQGGMKESVLLGLKYSDIKNKNISIIKLPELDKGDIADYKSYISIK